MAEPSHEVESGPATSPLSQSHAGVLLKCASHRQRSTDQTPSCRVFQPRRRSGPRHSSQWRCLRQNRSGEARLSAAPLARVCLADEASLRGTCANVSYGWRTPSLVCADLSITHGVQCRNSPRAGLRSQLPLRHHGFARTSRDHRRKASRSFLRPTSHRALFRR